MITVRLLAAAKAWLSNASMETSKILKESLMARLVCIRETNLSTNRLLKQKCVLNDTLCDLKGLYGYFDKCAHLLSCQELFDKLSYEPYRFL